MPNCPYEILLPLPFQSALALVEQTILENDFAILTRLDIQRMLSSQMHASLEPRVLLGLNDRKITALAMANDPSLALMFPCNIELESKGPLQTLIKASDPECMLKCNTCATDLQRSLASEASARMKAFINALREGAAILSPQS